MPTHSARPTLVSCRAAELLVGHGFVLRGGVRHV